MTAKESKAVASVQRWDCRPMNWQVQYHKSPTGEWVKFADHQSALHAAEAERDALQSRLDAVAGLADEWKRRVIYDDPDQGSQESNDGYDGGLTTCAIELRAALGCATTGEGGQ